MKSIRNRLNLIYGILIAAVFVLLGAVLLIPLENYFLKQAQSNLAPQVRIAAALVEPYILHEKNEELREIVKQIGKDSEIRLTVIMPDGTVIADSEHDYNSMDNHLERPEIKMAANQGVGYSIRMSNTSKQRMLYYAYTNKEYGKINSYVRVAESLSHIDEIYKHLRNILFAAITGAAAFALYAGFRAARGITTPIAHLRVVAEAIAQGNFDTRAQVNTNDELADLANAVNIMADKLNLYVKSINTEKEQLEIIFEHLSAGVAVLTSTGEILLINSTAEKLFNLPKTHYQGQILHRLVRDEGFEQEFREALQKNNAHEYEFKYREHYLRLHLVPLRTTSGEKKVVVLIYDISQIKQWQQMRSDFVANASHELRTPLTAIKGYTETLLDGALEDKAIAHTFLEIIDKESERLTRIVNDLLDLSNLERKAVLNREKFNLKTLIDSVSINFETPIKMKQLEFKNQVSENIEVYADYDWLEQVFVNLIDNAVKYSKQTGNVQVDAEEQGDILVIKVTDTGIGIPYQDLPRIFERFYRVDKSRSRSLGGTGLGLAIVKHIIESHGGNVSAQSSLGEGTVIIITIPTKLNTNLTSC